MDSLRAFDDGAEWEGANDEAAMDAPPGRAIDDRRLHTRLHRDWLAALRGREWPPLEDMPTGSLDGPNMLLLDLDGAADNPAIAAIGEALRREGGSRAGRADEISGDSLLWRLICHYRHVLATGKPIAFEGDYADRRGGLIAYRGLLLPMSCDGGRIDFIHGMLSWRELADSTVAAGIALEVVRGAGRIVHSGSLWDEQLPAAGGIAAFASEPSHPELPLGA